MDITEYSKLFFFGVVFMALTVTQHINSAKGRWLLAFPTSLLLSVFIWINTSFVAAKDVESFVVFSLGAATGASTGIWLSRRNKRKK